MKHEVFSLPQDTPASRQDRRASVSLMCQVRQGDDRWRMARLDDLSVNGFRIAWLPACRMHAKMWIRIPGLAPLPAEIRWRTNGGIGCEFARPLYDAVFDHIVAQALAQA